MQQTRGRPRRFDRESALRQAMHVFWNKGFEGTTMTDLTEAIGVKAPSLYAAFGDKNALFRKAVDQYAQTIGAGPINALHQGKGLREDLLGMLHASVALCSDPAAGRGCMVVTSAINCAPENAAHAAELAVRRQRNRSELEKRFRRAQQEAQLSATADIEGLSDFYAAVLYGLSLSARDGMDAKRLLNMMTHAMAVLDGALPAPVESA